jgi:hypothetical protein
LLAQIRERATGGGVAVFDLDGCLFDTRPRQVRIFREFAARYGFWELHQVEEQHFLDWDLEKTLRRAKVSEDFLQNHYPALRDFWKDCFFSSAYVHYDAAMPGAVALVRAVQAAGCQIVYLTGRDITMRGGTEAALRIFGFPYDQEKTHLLTKPVADLDDTLFKEQAMEVLAQLGSVCMYLDNEPANVNVYHQHHPDALVVFVETDHSPKPIEPAKALPWLRSFVG